jgi:hypothetical protein
MTSKRQSINTSEKAENWWALVVGLLAIFALKSLFENDETQTLSKRGHQILDDDNKMKEVESKIDSQTQSKEAYQEVII